MTAVNVCLDSDGVHFFTDGGHFDGSGALVQVGSKVMHLPRYDAALTLSGPSDALPRLLEAIERSNATDLSSLCEALPGMVERIIGAGVPYSVILAGIDLGVALEENGKAHRLGPGSVIRSPACHLHFDAEDIAGSGLAILERQKAEHRLVGGLGQHSIVRSGSFESRTVARWPIELARQARSVAAKIDDLQVDTIHVANFAVNGIVSGASAIFVPNELPQPIKIIASAVATYQATTGDSKFSAQCNVVKASNGQVIGSGTVAFAGATGGSTQTQIFAVSAVDTSSPSGETYSVVTQALESAGVGMVSSLGSPAISATYKKR